MSLDINLTKEQQQTLDGMSEKPLKSTMEIAEERLKQRDEQLDADLQERAGLKDFMARSTTGRDAFAPENYTLVSGLICPSPTKILVRALKFSKLGKGLIHAPTHNDRQAGWFVVCMPGPGPNTGLPEGNREWEHQSIVIESPRAEVRVMPGDLIAASEFHSLPVDLPNLKQFKVLEADQVLCVARQGTEIYKLLSEFSEIVNRDSEGDHGDSI